jgi:CubicO group peptidase (beta-lactamase class C family)
MQIDELAATQFFRSRMGSLTVGVVSGDKLVWTKSYGNAESPASLTANQDTEYRIGSITKMFTATILEQLVEAGKLQLSDPVEKYFPEVNTIPNRYKDASPVTLLQLATHTSGLSREPDHTDKYVKGEPEVWRQTLIAALPHMGYEFKPGEKYSYSNIGYAVLGAALEQAAGEPYLEYIPHHIFAPLGMTHTTLELTPDVQRHLAKGYEMAMGLRSSFESDAENKKGRGYKVPNGAIYTTVGDMAKFASFLMGDGPASVLAPARLLHYQNDYVIPTGTTNSGGYGLGMMFLRLGKAIVKGHGGEVSGYSAALYLNRDAKVAVIVLSSAGGNGSVNVDALALRALDILSK